MPNAKIKVLYGAVIAERRGSVVVSTSAWHTICSGFIPRTRHAYNIRCRNLALNIRDCVSLVRRRGSSVVGWSATSTLGQVHLPRIACVFRMRDYNLYETLVPFI